MVQVRLQNVPLQHQVGKFALSDDHDEPRCLQILDVMRERGCALRLALAHVSAGNAIFLRPPASRFRSGADQPGPLRSAASELLEVLSVSTLAHPILNLNPVLAAACHVYQPGGFLVRLRRDACLPTSPVDSSRPAPDRNKSAVRSRPGPQSAKRVFHSLSGARRSAVG